MDLLKGPIRDGSRGGRNEFSWSEIKDSKDREYYLGVSVKAPTGRWQQGRDVLWYSRAGGGTDSQDEAVLAAQKARAEEIRKIKEAESDALSAALGFPVTRRRVEGEVSQGEVDRAIKEAGEGGDDHGDEVGNGKGIGFGRTGMPVFSNDSEVMAGDQQQEEFKWRPAKADGKRDDKRDRKDRRDDSDRERHRHKSSRHRSRSPRRRSRSRDRDRDRDRDRRRRHEAKHDSYRRRDDRSRSPGRSPRRKDRDQRDRRDYDKRDRNDGRTRYRND